MRQRLIASAVSRSSPAQFCGALATAPQPPTLEQLERELEVLRGKLRTLVLAHNRIERSAQELGEAIEGMRQRATTAGAN
jgi:hypothetical protein